MPSKTLAPYAILRIVVMSVCEAVDAHVSQLQPCMLCMCGNFPHACLLAFNGEESTQHAVSVNNVVLSAADRLQCKQAAETRMQHDLVLIAHSRYVLSTWKASGTEMSLSLQNLSQA